MDREKIKEWLQTENHEKIETQNDENMNFLRNGDIRYMQNSHNQIKKTMNHTYEWTNAEE